jgi:hypothetical protein
MRKRFYIALLFLALIVLALIGLLFRRGPI